ncbi:nucleoside deaminase [Nocardioides albus]|uniref:tRNA(Adenine34) deaminase n=1 Tax=Nocardioides albus TaxID=1841 RepID=A0A7W5A635_9ACTN|nr:nucleoside deaminase [Nocardioides albus]MBB3090150.1 tRNA(adenine34) deaminase [Nocardioides albus]
MDPEDAVVLAVEAAGRGLAMGEMPIGAVVLLGDEVIASAFTSEKAERRRMVHADLRAMDAADRRIGFARRDLPLTLAVNLEPCLMCLGAAVTLGIDHVYFGLWSPDDGGVEAFAHWKPRTELPFFKPPSTIEGGFCETAIREQFAAYAADDSHPTGMRQWCAGLAHG